MTADPTLSELFANHSGLELTVGDLPAYQSFRYQEPYLVSCLDESEEKQEPEVLILEKDSVPLGTISLVIKENKIKCSPSNRYGRLDLIIVGKKFRNLGVGRLLLMSGIIYLLNNYGNQLYSISCLAAHKMVEQCLTELSFQVKQREGENFYRATLNLEEQNKEEFKKKLIKHSLGCAKMLHYKLSRI